MANVLLTKDSKPVDFHCPCCGLGEFDASFMSQLLHFLGYTNLTSLVATSGYRCAQHNVDVGGKPDSKHLVGRAIDISTKTIQLKTLVLDAAHQAGLLGIGMGPYFIHLDNREIPATWTYPKKS